MLIVMLLHKSIKHDSRVRREAKALARAGHDVTVVHLPRTPGELDGDLDGFQVVSATPPRWVRERIPFALYRVIFLIWFVRAALRRRPDAVHAHDCAMLVPGWIASRLARARLVYDTHEYAPGVPYRERLWAWSVNLVEQSLIGHCDAVITVSDGISERLRDRYGLQDRPTVVRNVPDPDAYAPGFEAPDLRAQLGMEPGSPLVLHLGAAAQDRGCETLVRAMSGLDGAHVLFLGADDRGYVGGLTRLAARSGIAGRVHFRPSVAVRELGAFTRQADVGVSLLEDSCENHRLALPNKIFEYLMSGLPVVASDLPEARSLLHDRDDVVLADARDPGSVTDALRAALSLEHGAGNGAAWSWDTEADALVAAYAAIPHRSRKPATRRTALVFVRNGATHDARIKREAQVLRSMGVATSIAAVVTDAEQRRREVIDGIEVLRLRPATPGAGIVRGLRSRGRSPGARAGVDAAVPQVSERLRSGHVARAHRLVRTIDYYRRAIGLALRMRPSVVHCNDYNTAWIGVAAKAFAGSAMVYDCHELWPDRNLRPEPRWWLLACEFVFVRVADRVLTTSPGYAEVIARRYRVEPPKVIRNVPAWTTPSEEPARPSGSPLAVYFGALTKNRGLESAIDALALVPELRMRFVGPEAWGHRHRLEQRALAAGVHARLELRAPVAPEDAPSVLEDADLGLALIEPACLSYRLTLPNKVFEYAAAGVPVLSGDVPVLADFVREHGLGLVVNARDPQAIAHAIERMLDPVLQERFRRSARDVALTVTWEAEAERLALEYRRVLTG